MAVDGAGYACAVGNKQVLCLHGNEDAWNIVDFKELLDVNLDDVAPLVGVNRALVACSALPPQGHGKAAP